MSWSATQYVKFESERSRPVRDLLAQILAAHVSKAADLGCGPGNSTELLQARFPEAAITAIDSSPDMIDAARKRLSGIHFEVEDIARWSSPGPFDVILANAALQWVPNHNSLLPALMAKVVSGGSLAVQMPDNHDEPAHRLMREIAGHKSWAQKLAGASDTREIQHGAGWYYRVLRGCAASVNIWRTTYHHAFAGGAHDVTEWFKGSGLRPFLDPLDERERSAFLERYKASVELAYPALPDGTILLPFPRLFFVATR